MGAPGHNAAREIAGRRGEQVVVADAIFKKVPLIIAGGGDRTGPHDETSKIGSLFSLMPDQDPGDRGIEHVAPFDLNAELAADIDE